jgi:hypothetical protein
MEDANYFMKYNEDELKKYYNKLSKSYLKKLLKSRGLKLSFILFLKSDYVYKLLEDDQNKRLDYVYKLKQKHIDSNKLELRQGKYTQQDLKDFLDLYSKIISLPKDDFYMFDKEKSLKKLGKFPDNIDSIYWIYEEKDDDFFSHTNDINKYMICKFKNNNYVYIKIHLTYFSEPLDLTNMEPDESIIIDLEVFKNPSDLLKRMDDKDYYYYFKNTKPIKR